jgi:hypothetical protein
VPRYGTEGVTIVLDDVHQLSFKSGGLVIIKFNVHTPKIVPLQALVTTVLHGTPQWI